MAHEVDRLFDWIGRGLDRIFEVGANAIKPLPRTVREQRHEALFSNLPRRGGEF